MAVSLTKGGNVSLEKVSPGIKNIMVGLGWDPRGTVGQQFDLDGAILLLGERLDDMSGRSFDNADFFRWDGSVTDDALYDLILNEVAGAMDAMRRLKLLA
jgi:tellurium resistance protein TerD